MTKSEIRQSVDGCRRQAGGAEEMAGRGRRAQERLIGLPEFQRSWTLACYLAMPVEVQTDGILAACAADGRRVAVPAWRPEQRAYGLCWLEPGAPLRRGIWGIAEPEQPAWLGDEPLDLIVVPAVAFDERCGRLGHGGGYYDRMCLLPAAATGLKVGLGFEWQMFESVPMEAHDVFMDAVVTEERTLRRGGV
jgi:5-formyltetrahydrofolate cyclo-ligase